MDRQEMSKYMLGELTKKATYAINSKSRDLVYETYGMAKGMYIVGTLEREDFYVINELLVKNTINNGNVWRDFK